MMIVIGYCFLCLGTFFLVTAGIGLLRMPDFYSRLHPAGVGDSLGVPLMCLGMACLSDNAAASWKFILLMIFILITGPTACHALAKAAYSASLLPWRKNSPPASPEEIKEVCVDTE